MMTNTKVEKMTDLQFTLVSEDRSRRPGRGRRLLPVMSFGFVFLALCLLLTDFRHLDLFAGKQENPGRHMVHEARPFEARH
jgi:hypothetical protein